MIRLNYICFLEGKGLMRKRVLLPVLVGLLCFPLTELNTDKARAAVSPLAGETAGTADNAAAKDKGIQIARGGGRGGGGRGGGRGGGAHRGGGGHKNVNRGGNRSHNANRNTNRNRNTNTNRNRTQPERKSQPERESQCQCQCQASRLRLARRALGCSGVWRHHGHGDRCGGEYATLPARSFIVLDVEQFGIDQRLLVLLLRSLIGSFKDHGWRPAILLQGQNSWSARHLHTRSAAKSCLRGLGTARIEAAMAGIQMESMEREFNDF